MGGAQAATHFEPVEARQHHVEDDGVVVVLGGEPQAVGPVEGDVDRVALLAQATFEEGRHPRLVLDDQDSHGDERTVILM